MNCMLIYKQKLIVKESMEVLISLMKKLTIITAQVRVHLVQMFLITNDHG